MISKDTENIQVMVRVRPLNQREKDEGAISCIVLPEDNKSQIILDTQPEPKKFNFDVVVDKEITQENIFHIVGKPVTDACLDGYNACIFAYGQTGAGKTFTMQGRGLDEGRDSQLRGLQPRVFDYVFAMINQIKKDKEIEYLVKGSYLEIYNEQISDLLGSQGVTLNVREDIKKGVYVENLTEDIITNGDEAIELLTRGVGNRHVGATKMNAESSRSHSVFSLQIQSRQLVGGMNNCKASKLHFVDLAGSERQKQTQAAGDRLKEAANINKSLTVLGQVINTLVECSGGKQRHIPYRDSKLTFILKDSLGGNSRTFMIANISAANTSFLETMSTLKFAQRAKQIKNKASVNEESSGNVEALKKEVKRLKGEIEDYKKQVKDLSENPGQNQQQQQQQQNNNDDKLTPYDKIKNSLGRLTPNLVFGSNTKQREQTINQFLEQWNEKLQILIDNVEQTYEQQQQQNNNQNEMEIEEEVNPNEQQEQLFQQRMEVVKNFQGQQSSLVQKLKEIQIEPTVSGEQIFSSEEYQNLKKEMDELKHNFNNQIKDLNHQNELKEQSIADKISEIGDANKKYGQLEIQLNNQIEENKNDKTYYEEQMEKIKQTMQEEIDIKYQNKDELEKRIVDLNLKCEELQEKLDKESHELEKQNTKYEEKIQELNSLQEDKDKLKQQYEQVFQQKSELSELKFSLEKSLEEGLEKQENMKKMIQELTAKNQEISMQNLEFQECTSKLVQECENYKSQISELELQILQEKEHLDLEKDKLQMANQQIKLKQEEMETLTQSLEYTETQLENKQRECKNLTENLNNVQQQLTDTQENHIVEIKQITEQLTIQLQQSQEFKKEIQELGENLIQEQKQKNLLETEKQYFQQELKQINLDFQKSKQAQQAFQKLCEENELKYQQQIQELEQQNQKQQTFQMMLEENKDRMEQQIEQYKCDIENKDNEIQKLQEDIQGLEQVMEEKINLENLTQEKLVKLNTQMVDITQELINMTEINQQMELSNHNQQQQIQQYNQQIEKNKQDFLILSKQQQYQKNKVQNIIMQQKFQILNMENRINYLNQKSLKSQILDQAKFFRHQELSQQNQIIQEHLQQEQEYSQQQTQEVNDLKELRNNDKQEIEKLLQNSQSLCDSNMELQQNMKNQKENLEKYSEEIKQLKQKIQDLNLSYKDKQEKLNQEKEIEENKLQKQNKDNLELIEKLNTQLEQQSNQIRLMRDKYDQDIQELSELIEKSQKSSFGNEHHDKLKIQYSELENKFNKQQEIFNKQLTDKSQDLNKAKSLIREISFNKREYEQKLDDLTKDNQKLNKSNIELVKKIKDYNTEKIMRDQKLNQNEQHKTILQKNQQITKLTNDVNQLKIQQQTAIQKLSQYNKNISQSNILKEVQDIAQLKLKLNNVQAGKTLRDALIKELFNKIDNFMIQNMHADSSLELKKQQFYDSYKQINININSKTNQEDTFDQKLYEQKFQTFIEYITQQEKEFLKQYYRQETEKSKEQYNLLKKQKYSSQKLIFDSPSLTNTTSYKSQQGTPTTINQKRIPIHNQLEQEIQENINPNIQNLQQQQNNNGNSLKKLKQF